MQKSHRKKKRKKKKKNPKQNPIAVLKVSPKLHNGEKILESAEIIPDTDYSLKKRMG